MNCQETQDVIDAYVDGELDLVRTLDIERHIHDCESCGRVHRSLMALRGSVRDGSLYFKAPAGLERRIRSDLRSARGGNESRRLPMSSWMAVAASLAFIAAVAWAFLHGLEGAPQQLLAQEVVSSHVRSLMAAHLYDVESTDQHTVKPWFDGKIDFAPEVRDFKAESFALQGGRLDYLTGRPVAALVYRHDKHYINLFIWPAERQADYPETMTAVKGYELIHWVKAGMNYWAVSDTNEQNLRRFAGLVREHESPATMPVKSR